MNATVEDLSPTIIPKSDQLNADQLIGGPMTIIVSEVRVTTSDEQPVVVHYEGDNGRPFKPCKTMRKLLLAAWGSDGRAWSGRAMTLYHDASVRFGKDEVGGIRISHLSDIERDIRVNLTSTKGKKALHEVKRMARPSGPDYAQAMVLAGDAEALKEAFASAYKSTKDAALRARYKATYDARLANLSKKPAAFDLPAALARLQACADRESLALLADDLRIAAEGNDEALAAIGRAFDERDAALAG